MFLIPGDIRYSLSLYRAEMPTKHATDSSFHIELKMKEENERVNSIKHKLIMQILIHFPSAVYECEFGGQMVRFS
jgi:hypothetical protein